MFWTWWLVNAFLYCVSFSLIFRLQQQLMWFWIALAAIGHYQFHGLPTARLFFIHGIAS